MAIMALTTTSLVFRVRRCEPELVTPAKPTPHEFKQLSDVDDQEDFRFHMPIVQFYRHDPSMQGRDPVKVIREALSQTLVFYYPFAGRLREGLGRKLTVECTGEGVIFIEADADVTLEQFGDALHPPFPCADELLYHVPGSREIVNCPLLLIQVTRLKCGGFIFVVRFNHTMSDAIGIVKFMTAVGEMARGACVPSIAPVWERDLLNARDPPRATHTHNEFDEVADTKDDFPLPDMVPCSFFFGSNELNGIRQNVPPHLRQCSKFEVITACVWKCIVTALEPDPSETQLVRIKIAVNMRTKCSPPLPKGYYGNAHIAVVAVATARKLCENPLGYAVELVKMAKDNVTEDYMRSLIDLSVVMGNRAIISTVRSYFLTDLTRVGFEEVDFGWGKAIYGGPTCVWSDLSNPKLAGFHRLCTNGRGENGIVVSFNLPTLAVERFVKELNSTLTNQPISGPNYSTSIRSSI